MLFVVKLHLELMPSFLQTVEKTEERYKGVESQKKNSDIVNKLEEREKNENAQIMSGSARLQRSLLNESSLY